MNLFGGYALPCNLSSLSLAYRWRRCRLSLKRLGLRVLTEEVACNWKGSRQRASFFTWYQQHLGCPASLESCHVYSGLLYLHKRSSVG